MLKRNRKYFVVSSFMIAFMIILVSGCRQGPSKPTKYYERELSEMRAKARMEAEKNSLKSKYLQDGYPWQGRADRVSVNRIPSRIGCKQKAIEAEINYIHEFLRGKKKKLQLRD